MNHARTFLSAAGLAAALVSPGAAAPVTWATAVEWRDNGTVGRGRDDTRAALGAPELTRDGTVNFLSLGRGGAAIFDFGVWFGGSAIIHETTWGDQAPAGRRYPEAAEIFVSADHVFGSGADAARIRRDFVRVGPVTNGVAVFGALIDLPTGAFRYLAVIDASRRGSGNGFDVNAVGVQAAPAPIPLPGGLALTAGAVAGLGLVARRRRAAYSSRSPAPSAESPTSRTAKSA